jgi:hypothetical protein
MNRQLEIIQQIPTSWTEFNMSSIKNLKFNLRNFQLDK